MIIVFFAICKTATGDIYLGTMFGLVRYNKQSDDFDRIPELNGKFIYDIKEDSAGNIWLATYANGVYCYNVNDRKWKNYVHDDKDNTSLPYNKVSSVFEDSHRQIWLTTQGEDSVYFIRSRRLLPVTTLLMDCLVMLFIRL